MSRILKNRGFPCNEQERNDLLLEFEKYSLKQPYILVIDDYRQIRCREFEALLLFFIHNKVNNFHILIISRTVPNLHIDELVLKGFCNRIEESSFLLSESEIEHFFSLNKIALNREMITNVFKLTSGWITAVYEVLENYKLCGEISYCDKMDDIIRSMVIDTFSSEETRRVKILTLLESFSIEYAMHVLDRQLSVRELRKLLNHSGLFIREPSISNYKVQFFLVDYFRRNCTLDKDIEVEIYRRSGQWFVDNGNLKKGIENYLLGSCIEDILNIFEKKSSRSLFALPTDIVMKVFTTITKDLKYEYPILYLSYIIFYITNIDFEEGRFLLEEFSLEIESQREWTKEIFAEVKGEIEIAMSCIEFNDIYKIYIRHKRAYEILERKSKIVDSGILTYYRTIHISYLFYREVGSYLEIAKFVHMKYHTLEQLTGGIGVGFENVFMGEFFCETANYFGCIIEGKKGLYKAIEKGHEDIALCSRVLLSRAYFWIGEWAKGVKIFEKIIELEQKCLSPILSNSYEIAIAYLGYQVNSKKNMFKGLKD